MDKTGEACLRASELSQDLGDGHIPTDAERAFLDEHLRSCAGCRLERAAAAALAHTGDSGPAEPLDQLGRRRFINEAVTAALGAMPLQEDAPAVQPAPAPPRWRRLGVALAAGLLLVVGLGLGLWLLRNAAGGGASPAGTPAAPRSPARLVLAAGDVRVDGAVATGQGPLTPGQRVTVRRGRAALGLPDGAYVMLEDGATLRVGALGPARTSIHLEGGELLASVTPRRDRRPFVVTTRAGRVEVTGTVFAVRVTSTAVLVRVVRGQVRVVEPGRPPRPVSRGQATVLGTASGAVRALAPAEEAQDLRRAATLGRLGTAEAATVTIQSRPTGARVEVDGALLGHTPLVAAVRPGHPLLRVSLPGRSLVQERLTVRAGDRIGRDYELGPAPVASRDGSGPPRPTAVVPGDDGPGGDAMVFAPTVVSRAPPGRPAPRAVTPAARPEAADARSLIGQARQRRAARDWAGAARAYRALLRQHRRSTEAHAARVALGLLLLDQLGNPRGALGLFDAYLAATRQGPLAQEAAYGRIRALRRLGRRAAEIAALRDFLHYYPGALQEPFVRRRLQAVTAAPSSMAPATAPAPAR